MVTWTDEMKERMRVMIAGKKCAREIGEALGIPANTVLSANRRYKLGTFEVGHKMQIPPQLADLWPTHSIREIAEMLGANRGSISRWGKAAGLPSKQPRNTEKARLTNNDRKRTMKPNQGFFVASGPKQVVIQPFRHDGAVGEAQRLLQRDCSVYRRDDGNWQCGRLVLTSAELLDRAERVRARRAA